MALVGRKDFVRGDVPVAADLNQMAAQCIQVFPSISERNSRYQSPNLPEHGEMSWIVDSGILEYYDGLNWV